MVYHVIIALDSLGRRDVGQIICVLESYGLELTEISKQITHPRVVEHSRRNQLILEYQLNQLDAMNWYQEKFSPEVLTEKINHFYRNHVELFFDGEERNINPNEIWERIAEEVFERGRKLPIIFVLTSGEENGINVPFIQDDLELDEYDYFNPRTIIPLGEEARL